MICAAGVDKMGKACGTYGREMYSEFWWEKPKKREKLGISVLDGMAIKIDHKEINVGRCDVD